MDPSLHLLGKITKMHGFNGTVVLVSEQELDYDLENLQEIFIMIDGLPVPFPVEELELRTETLAHLQLEFVANQNEALELMGCDVYAEVIPHKQDVEAGMEQWISYTVHDAAYGNIGVIQKIEDYKGNIVLQIMDGDKETLISLYPELVTHIDNQEKILFITAPDGYF